MPDRQLSGRTGGIVENFALLAAAISLVIAMIAANAKGCIRRSTVGAVAEHAARHHCTVGAADECAIGHHKASKAKVGKK